MTLNRKISLGLAVSIAALTAIAAILLTYSAAMNIFEARMSSVTDRQATNDLLSEIDGKIRQEYYGDINEQTLRDAIGNGIITGLRNEYCAYLTEGEWELESSRIAGYDFGFGIDISRASDGNILVNRVVSGSPASSAGIKKGDIINRVNDTTVLSIGYDRALAALTNANTAKLTIVRDGIETGYSVTKERFTGSSVEYSIVADKVGYVRIYSFNETTSDQFNAAYSALKTSGVGSIMLDLRDNSGDGFEYAAAVLDTILPQGNIMFMTDKTGEKKVMYTSDVRSVPLALSILINDQTAGAAEMFASCVYDYGRCTLVGTATKGQMLVPQYFELSDGSALKLTVGEWSTDRGNAVEDGRLVPQFEVRMTTYQYENRYVLAFEDDPQMQTSLSLLQAAMEEIAANEAEAIEAYTSGVSESDVSDEQQTEATATDAAPEAVTDAE